MEVFKPKEPLLLLPSLRDGPLNHCLGLFRVHNNGTELVELTLLRTSRNDYCPAAWWGLISRVACVAPETGRTPEGCPDMHRQNSRGSPTSLISAWHTVRSFLRPKAMTKNSKWPRGLLKAVFHSPTFQILWNQPDFHTTQPVVSPPWRSQEVPQLLTRNTR